MVTVGQYAGAVVQFKVQRCGKEGSSLQQYYTISVEKGLQGEIFCCPGATVGKSI